VALTVDVEEWFHNCWVPEYVDPARRPALVAELDRRIPELLERFARLGARATFFVLGEVAARWPLQVREIERAGHEIACHGDLHLRANDRSLREFREDLRRARQRLEDCVGRPVIGFRAPEWSLRRPDNPRLRIVAELGFHYDSSLVPAVGSGAAENPRVPTRFRWPDGLEILELPPHVWGSAVRLPANGWCARTLPPSWLAASARAAGERGETPLLVVHPWELTSRAVPGLLTGFARFFHECGRGGFGERFDRLVAELGAEQTLAVRCAAIPSTPDSVARAAAQRTGAGFASTVAGATT